MKKRLPFFLISSLVFLAIVVGLIVWQWDALVDKIAGEKIDEDRQAWMERTRELEAMILELQQGKESRPLLPTQRLSQVFGPNSSLVKGVSPRSMKCQELEESLRSFCQYLDAGETFRSQKTHRDQLGALYQYSRFPGTAASGDQRGSLQPCINSRK